MADIAELIGLIALIIDVSSMCDVTEGITTRKELGTLDAIYAAELTASPFQGSIEPGCFLPGACQPSLALGGLHPWLTKGAAPRLVANR